MKNQTLFGLETAKKKPSKSKRAAGIFPQTCVAVGLPEPVAEYRFHPSRKWRIDWFFEGQNGRKVALEVEGGVWTGGRHTRSGGFVGDMEKYNEIAAAGILLLRVQPKELLSQNTINLLKKSLGT